MPVIVLWYACYYGGEVNVANAKTLKRKSFYIDEDVLRRARRALRVRTDADAIRLSLERVAEMEKFRRFMDKSHGVLKRGSLEVL